MKYALISEEQIKRIQHTLKTGRAVMCGAKPNAFALGYLDGAIKDVQSLKPSEPDAWITRGTFSGRFQICDSDSIYAIPAYALDEVTHD